MCDTACRTRNVGSRSIDLFPICLPRPPHGAIRPHGTARGRAEPDDCRVDTAPATRYTALLASIF